MTTVGRSVSMSLRTKVRPARSGICIVSKNPGVTRARVASIVSCALPGTETLYRNRLSTLSSAALNAATPWTSRDERHCSCTGVVCSSPCVTASQTDNTSAWRIQDSPG